MVSQPHDLSKLPPSKRIMFVVPTGRFDSLTSSENRKEEQPGDILTGEEVSNIYEDIINKASTSSKHENLPIVRENKKKKLRQKKEEFTVRDESRFLRAASEGDIQLVGDFICKGMDVDVSDSFGWTALHCAVASGHTSTALLLIEKGINWSARDNSGKSFVDVGVNTKQYNCVQAINAFFSIEDEVSEDADEQKYCKDCGRNYSGSEKDHMTNLSHLLRLSRPHPIHSGYAIPEWNPGFRLLRKAGWEGDGLGKEQKGRKYPIRTVLKRNRAGFGSEKGTARVTHFEPFDEKAVQLETKTTPNKETRDRRDKKHKRIEMEVRDAFKGL